MHSDEQVGEITIRDVRCACAVCGAHVMAWQGHELSGWCGVCGSYELHTLPAPARSHRDGLGGRGEEALGLDIVSHGEAAYATGEGAILIPV
ncbi:MAG: hypothetical protein E6G41_07935 [Actinobacteria bacterium]|nr:MAG: hypothetical protein E6G41_07935 [Actinomycetota bacterium]